MSESKVCVGIDVSRARLDVALTACMRKLLVILNTIMKTRRMWDEHYALTS